MGLFKCGNQYRWVTRDHWPLPMGNSPSVLEMGVLSHLLSQCCIDGGRTVSGQSLAACPV